MKKTIPIYWLVLALWLPTMSAWTDDRGPIQLHWPSDREDIGKSWQTRQRAKFLGVEERQGNPLQQIWNIGQKYRLHRLPELANALAREAQATPNQSEDLLVWAERFDPLSPAPDYVTCRQLWSPRHWSSCFHGLRKQVETRSDLQRMLVNLVLSLLYAYLATVVVVGLVLVSQNTARLSSFWIRSFGITAPWANWLINTLLAILAWLVAGPLGLVFLFMALLHRQLSTQQNIVIVMMAIIAMAIPSALYLPSLYLQRQSEVLDIIEQPFVGLNIEGRMATLTQHISRQPKDADAVFTLALMHTRLGRYQNAQALYDECATLQPQWHLPQINLAVIEHINGQTNNAIQRLTQVSQRDPGAILAHFNLSKMFISQARLNEGRRHLDRAKEIDGQLLTQLESISKGNQAIGNLVEATLSSEQLHLRRWQIDQQTRDIRNNLFRVFSPQLGLWLFWLSLTGLMLWRLVALRTTGKQSTTLSLAGNEGPLFDMSHGGEFSQRLLPSNKQWEQLKTRWLTLVYPGLHLYFRHHDIVATLNTGLVMLCLVPLIAQHALLAHPMLWPNLPGFPIKLLCIALLVILYFGNVFHAMRREA